MSEANDISPLEREIRRRIAAAGPMPLSEYMSLCLGHPEHGYYVTRDPLGARGDFITAPEISQMFGELIGLWMAATWQQLGAPVQIRIVELGPGRGTLMADAIRAVEVVPKFREAVSVHLVEISPALRKQQEQTLSGIDSLFWHDTLADVPSGPAIIIANEFFDALPVKQAFKQDGVWHERCVGIGDDGKLNFTVAAEPSTNIAGVVPAKLRNGSDGEIFEWRADTVAMEIGRRIGKSMSAALVIDYGHAESAMGDTLQAVGRHAYADALTSPGNVDLTAHVDFEALGDQISAMGAAIHGPLTQGEFLHRLGIDARAQNLKAGQPRKRANEIDAAVARLTGFGRTSMGELFKVMACADPRAGTPPGFS